MRETILLVNPNRMKPAVAPIALDYLAAALRARGFAVELLDLCFAEDPPAAVEACLAARSFNAIGVTIRNTDDCYLTGQDFFVPSHAKVVLHIKAHSKAPVVLGGAGFSVAPATVLELCGADYGIVGDGETAFPELLRRLSAGVELNSLPGLVHRQGERIVVNKAEWGSESLAIPRTRRTVDGARYFAEGGMGGVETKRGCGQACIYCADPLSKGRVYRLRPARAVADEVGELMAQGITCWHTCDAEFNLPPEHAASVCDEFIRRGFPERMSWYAYACPHPFTPELASLMKRAGCAGVNFGVDSGCDRMLSALGRHFTASHVRRTAEICHAEGLTFMYDLLLGGPGEDRESVAETVALMNEVKPDRAGVATGVRIYAGTRLAALVQEEGFSKDNPNLRGTVAGNAAFLAPVFYLSARLGPDPLGYIAELIGNDPRFFVPAKSEKERNYNYNDNSVLVTAIRNGCRGAYWDILRRLADGEKPPN